MVEAFKCSNCSAPVLDDRWTNCPYCGAVLDKPTTNPLRAVVAPERFEAVARSPEFAALQRHDPSGGGVLAAKGFQTVFLLIWTLMAGGMTIFSLAVGPLAIVPALMCAFGIFMLVRAASDTGRFAQASTRRFVAVVRDERTQVDGGGKNSSATTRHFLLLETRDGARQEHVCSAEVAGLTVPGDIGVAYLRADVLLEFRRVDV